MSVFPSAMRSKAWIFWVTALSLVLGGLLAASLKTQQSLRLRLGVSPVSRGGLVAAWSQQVDANKELQAEIAALRRKNTEQEQQLAGGEGISRALNNTLQDTKFLAGLTAVEGPGVIVTLEDSKQKDSPALSGELLREVREQKTVHDWQVRDVVDELRSAGAEAISVDDQRVIATTGIRCVGGVILVNDAKIASPIRIRAVGNPKNLMGALTMAGGLIDNELGVYGMMVAREAKKISIPSYNGSTRFVYAKPVPERG
jgi:uncharacterized protein YlxW (UPF0749 family)